MRQRSDFSMAMIASLLLHGGLLAAVMLTKPWEHALPMGGVVPVNIVSNSELTDLRAAAQAAQAQEAATPAPVPEAPPAPAEAAPQPQPQPQPVPPPPAPKPAVDPNAKGQQKPAPKVEKSLDLDALAASISKVAKAQGAKASSAAKGPARPETALEARPAAGAARGLSANALAGLAGELQRRWNPNCEVEGGRDVKVRATFTLSASGTVVSGPNGAEGVDVGGLNQSPNPVVRAAAERAIRAIHQAAPFAAQYRDAFGQKLSVNFNAREACA